MDNEKLAGLLVKMSIFGIVVAIWMTGVVIWWLKRSKHQRKLERRLQFAQQGDEERVIRLWHDGQAVDAFVPDTESTSIGERLDRLREDAGWVSPMPQIFIFVGFIAFAVAAIVWVMSGRMVPAVAGVGVVIMVFRMLLLSRIHKRTAIFERQLVEALDLAGRSLRAGHPLNGAFKLIASEIGAPVSTLFNEIIDQEALGVSLQRALTNASQKSRSSDMKIFATSVVIQLRTGGNLADMIDRVSWVLRERMRLSRRARVLTAEANLSKWILTALPIGVFTLLYLVNPTYMEPFFKSVLGYALLVISGIMLMIGAWVMNRMASIKY